MMYRLVAFMLEVSAVALALRGMLITLASVVAP